MKSSFRGISALALLTVITGSANAEAPFSAASFKEVCAAARKSKRIVLIDFYTTWCGPCKLLDRNTWSDRTVRSWLAKMAVCRKTDAEKETALASRYHITAYPTILLLRPDGTEIDRLVGYRDPKTFLTEARQALSGRDSIARAKAKLSGSHRNDPDARMDYARALAEKGHPAEALKEYLWCLDDGMKNNPAYYGVRLSFLLSDIKALGAGYPPALDALKQRRDAARAVLDKGTASRDIAMDFSAYNETLGQPEQTLSLYEALIAQRSPAAKHLFIQVSDSLLGQKRYADMVSGAGDISILANGELEQARTLTANAKTDKDLRAYVKQNAVEKCCGYYEALVGADKVSDASALRDRVLAFDGSAATYVSLVQHARRAAKPEAVQQLLTLAKSALSSDDFKQVEQAAK